MSGGPTSESSDAAEQMGETQTTLTPSLPTFLEQKQESSREDRSNDGNDCATTLPLSSFKSNHEVPLKAIESLANDNQGISQATQAPPEGHLFSINSMTGLRPMGSRAE